MTHFDADLLVWSGKRDTTGDCLSSPCTYNYDLERSDHHYYLANWDRHKNQTLTIKVSETYSIRLIVSLFSVFTAIISVFV